MNIGSDIYSTRKYFKYFTTSIFNNTYTVVIDELNGTI